ncbi:MAG: Lhr family ATP-dependent helicase, partial [Terriglobales bacterium]
LLLSLVRLPDAEVQAGWRPWLQALASDARALRHADAWIAAERQAWFCGAVDPALAGPVWPGVEFVGAEMSVTETVTVAIVGGWMEVLGPITVTELARRLRLDPSDTESALLALEGQGRVVRGPWLGEIAWCERRLLARIHRHMVRRLRAAIEPVAPAAFSRFLARWQHVDSTARLHGAGGLEAVLGQLQGLEAPASAWESSILPARVADYRPELLDQLCMSGAFAWARLHPSASARRAIPNRNSPITFFRREDAAWLLHAAGWKGHGERPLSPVATEVAERLQRRGASFFQDLTGQGLVPSQVEEGLWELAAAGRATADGFDSLRAFLDPKRRAGQGQASLHRPRNTGGRWSLLALPPIEPDAATGAAE